MKARFHQVFELDLNLFILHIYMSGLNANLHISMSGLNANPHPTLIIPSLVLAKLKMCLNLDDQHAEWKLAAESRTNECSL